MIAATASLSIYSVSFFTCDRLFLRIPSFFIAIT